MSYQSPYFQTTPLSGQALAAAISTAHTQNDAILAVFQTGIARTPSQVHSILSRMGKRWPVTSTRRGITTLQKSGALVKLDELRKGPYQAEEHQWIIAGGEA